MKSICRKMARAARHCFAKFAGPLLKALWPQYMSGGNVHDPNMVFGAWFRQKMLRRNGRVSWPVHRTTEVRAPERIQRGSRTPGLSAGCYLDGRNGIILGPNVWIGPHVSLISMNHDSINYEKYLIADPIRIDQDCWIGQGATVLPSVHLGPHTVVGAGAIVTKSFPSGNQLIGGNPARFIKHLPPYEN